MPIRSCASIAFATAFALSGCGGPAQSADTEDGRTYPVAAPGRGATIERTFVARVEAHRHVEIRTRLGGVVEAVEVDEGRTVAAGQVLYRISSRAARLEEERAAAVLASAEAEVEATTVEFKNTSSLAERSVVSPAELAQAKAKLAMATAKRDEAAATRRQAAVNVELAVIRAPFAGTVGRLPIKPGSVVAEDALLTTLTNADDALVYFRVSEAELMGLTAGGTALAGRRVQLRLADGSVYDGDGVIDAVDSAFDGDARTIAVRARFPNPSGVLRHGGTGTLVLVDELPDALVIPQRATFERQELLYVYVVGPADTVSARRVTPRGRTRDGFVVEGVGADERIVLEGIPHLRDGAQITVRGNG